MGSRNPLAVRQFFTSFFEKCNQRQNIYFWNDSNVNVWVQNVTEICPRKLEIMSQRVLNFKIFWKSMSTGPIEGRVAINNPELQEIQREYYYLEHPPSSSTHEEPKVSSVVIDYNMIIFIHCAASCIHLKCSNIRNISWIQWCIFHSTEHVHIWSICNMLPGKCQDQIICINYSTQFQL